MITDDAEHVNLVSIDHAQQQRRHRGNAYDSDDDEPQQGGVQCHTH